MKKGGKSNNIIMYLNVKSEQLMWIDYLHSNFKIKSKTTDAR